MPIEAVFSGMVSEIQQYDEKCYYVRDKLHSELTKYVLNLFQMGYDGENVDINGKSALHYAVECGFTDIMETIVKYYRDFNVSDTIFSKPLLVEHPIGYTIFEDSQIENSRLFNVVNRCDLEYKTPLFRAIERGYLDMACKLILYGASIDFIPEQYKVDLLKFAATEISPPFSTSHYQYRPVVGLLAINVPHVISHYDEISIFPKFITYWFLHGHIKVIAAIMNSIEDPEKQKRILNNVDSNYTLFNRINGSHLKDEVLLETTKYLLDHGVSKAANNEDPVLLIATTAAKNGYFQTLKYLMERVDKSHFHTFLGLATMGDHLQIVQYIWENYRQYTIDPSTGNTALHFAVQSGGLESVKYLCEHGADKNVFDKNLFGETPMSYGVDRKNNDIVDYLFIKTDSSSTSEKTTEQ